MICKTYAVFPRGTPQIEVSFEVDNNGILTVNAVEKIHSQQSQLQIVRDKGRFTEGEIIKLIEDANRYRQEDKHLKDKVERRNESNLYIYQIKNDLNETGEPNKFAVEEKGRLITLIRQLRQWLDDHPEFLMSRILIVKH